MNDNLKDPILIVGCGHSGTTILVKMLGTHSNIYPFGETSFLKKNKINEMIKTFNKVTRSKNKLRWVEKTPRHVYDLDRAMKYMPNCKIIIIMRHPISTIKSIYKRRGKWDIAIKKYINNNMEWFNHPDKKKFFVLKYEDLIEKTENTTKNILNFLNENYEDLTKYKKYNFRLKLRKGLLNFQNHRRLRKWQINQPLFNNIKKDQDIKTLNRQDLLYIQKYKVQGYSIFDMINILGYK